MISMYQIIQNYRYYQPIIIRPLIYTVPIWIPRMKMIYLHK